MLRCMLFLPRSGVILLNMFHRLKGLGFFHIRFRLRLRIRNRLCRAFPRLLRDRWLIRFRRSMLLCFPQQFFQQCVCIRLIPMLLHYKPPTSFL